MKVLNKAIFVLGIVAVLAMLSSVAAADDYYAMTATTHGGTGYHWIFNEKASHGVNFVHQSTIVPGDEKILGGTVCTVFEFEITDPDYFIELDLLDPNGNLIDTMTRGDAQSSDIPVSILMQKK